MHTNDRDWDSWDVKHALGKRGLSMADLARQHNLKPATLRDVFRRDSYPKVQRIIASALDMKPEQIWPSRYVNKAK